MSIQHIAVKSGVGDILNDGVRQWISRACSEDDIVIAVGKMPGGEQPIRRNEGSAKKRAGIQRCRATELGLKRQVGVRSVRTIITNRAGLNDRNQCRQANSCQYPSSKRFS